MKLPDSLWPEGAQFHEEEHAYEYGGHRFPSVTAIVSRYKRKFYAGRISAAIAKRDGRTQAEVLAEWDATRDEAAARGTVVHAVAEKVFQGGDPAEALEGLAPDHRERAESWLGVWQGRLKPKLQPIAAEQKVIDAGGLNIAGTIDGLAIDDEGRLWVCDWKTNKRFRRGGEYGNMQKPFEDLPDCEYSAYSLQLSLYRLILARHGVDTAGSFLVHIPPEGDPEVVQAADLRERAWEALKMRPAFTEPANPFEGLS